MKYIF